MTTISKKYLHILAANDKMLALLSLLWVFVMNGFATTYYSKTNGNWNDAASWTLTQGSNVAATAYPVAGDNAVIDPLDKITISANAECSSLTFENPGSQANQIAISGAYTLSVSGNITFSLPTGNKSSILSVGTGIVNASNITINGGSNSSGIAQVTVSTGTVNIIEGLIFGGTAAQAKFSFTDAGTLNIGGSLGAGGTFASVAGSTVNFNGTSAQTIPNSYVYSNVKINNAAGVSLAAPLTLLNLTIGDVTSNSIFRDAGFTISITTSASNTLTMSNSGKFVIGNGTATTMPASIENFALASGTTIEYASTASQTVFDITTNYKNLTLSGNATKTTTGVAVDGILSLEGTTNVGNVITYGSSSTLRYKGTSSRATTSNELPSVFPGSGGIIVDQGVSNTITLHQNVSNAGDLNVVSGTFNLSTFTTNRASAGGSLSISSGASLFIGGTNTLPSNYSTHSVHCNSTIHYNGSNQTVANLNSSQIYGNLTLSGSGTKTLQAATSNICGNFSISSTSTTAVTGLTIGGNMDIGASATFDAGGFTHIVRGNWSKAGIFTDNGSTIQFDGSSSQSIGASNFNHLTFTSAGVKTATAALSINGNLTITSNFTHGDGITHQLFGDFTNNGTYTPGTGTFIMDGTSKQNISGSNTITFNNLVINNTAGVQILNTAPMSVSVLTINSSKFIELSSNIHLFAENIVNNAGTSGILLKSVVDEPFPTLKFNNSISSPIEATVELATKGNLSSGNYNWQFVGLPITEVNKSYINLSGSFMRQFNEATVVDGISVTSPWTPVSFIMQAFRGYMITQSTPRVIPFSGTLMNQSQTLNLEFTASPVPTYQGLNLLANSFTAAIDITSLVFGSSVIEEVYLFNTGFRNTEQDPTSESGENSGQYLVVPKAIAGTLGLPGQISSMQAFFVQATAAGQTLQIPYSSAVNQTVNLRAPKISVEEDFVGTRLTLHSTKTMDHLWLFSNPSCSKAFDNGYDGNKMMGGMPSAQMYVSMEDRDYQVFATNDYDMTDITFVPGADSVYTIRANHHLLDVKYPLGLYLVDMLENVVVNMTNENTTYTFTTRSTDIISKRFRILSDVDNWTKDKELLVEDVKIAVADGKMIVISGSGAIQFDVFDATGKMVYQNVLHGDRKHIVNHVFERGTYIVKLVSDSKRVVQKVIVQ